MYMAVAIATAGIPAGAGEGRAPAQPGSGFAFLAQQHPPHPAVPVREQPGCANACATAASPARAGGRSPGTPSLLTILVGPSPRWVHPQAGHTVPREEKPSREDCPSGATVRACRAAADSWSRRWVTIGCPVCPRDRMTLLLQVQQTPRTTQPTSAPAKEKALLAARFWPIL